MEQRLACGKDTLMTSWSCGMAVIPERKNFTIGLILLTHIYASPNTYQPQKSHSLTYWLPLNQAKLYTSTYSKPTDKNSLLQFSYHHPRALRENLPYGQFLRIRRNCTNKEDFLSQSTVLTNKLSEKGYPKKILKPGQKRAYNANRTSLLENYPRFAEKKLACVTTFSSISNQVKKIVLKRWNILNSVQLHLSRPLFSFKRSKNIGDLVVHTWPARTNVQKTRDTGTFLPPVTGHHRCGNCSVCKFTTTSQTLTLADGSIWVQRSHINCNTVYCVYMITCPCNWHYTLAWLHDQSRLESWNTEATFNVEGQLLN